MQIKAVANTNANANFQSNEGMNKALTLVNMNDSQLKMVAYVSGRDPKKEKKNKNSLLRTLYAIPVIDTIASAVLVNKSNKLSDKAVVALRKTRLSKRVRVAATAAGFWAVSLSAIELYNIFKKGAESKSATLRKIDRDNPFTGFLIDMAAILVGGSLAIKGINKLVQKSVAKNPEKHAQFEKALRDTKRIMNKSKLNREIIPKLAKQATEFGKKFPLALKAGRFALANSVWILFGIGLAKIFSQSKNERNRVELNYKHLKTAQGNLSKEMIKRLAQERVGLYSQISELKNELEETKAASEDKACKSCHKEDSCCEFEEKTQAAETDMAGEAEYEE